MLLDSRVILLHDWLAWLLMTYRLLIIDTYLSLYYNKYSIFITWLYYMVVSCNISYNIVLSCSALMPLFGRQEGHLVCMKVRMRDFLGGGWLRGFEPPAKFSKAIVHFTSSGGQLNSPGRGYQPQIVVFRNKIQKRIPGGGQPPPTHLTLLTSDLFRPLAL